VNHLDDLSGVPRFEQIAAIVEAEIRDGVWSVGQPIPSRRTLTQRFGVAMETAARAHQRLADRGLVVAVPGIGTVVTPHDRWIADD
jgi:GntR family transcriptional regulator